MRRAPTPPVTDGSSRRADQVTMVLAAALVPTVFAVAVVSGLCASEWTLVPTALLAAVPGWVAFDSGRALRRRR